MQDTKNLNHSKYYIVGKAIVFATKAHAGQKRKGTDIPYITHPLEAAIIVATMTADPNIIAAAVLHDVMEDAKIKKEELTREFNDIVCDLVAGESENKREHLPASETWVVRKQETLDHLKEAELPSKLVALRDKLSNIRAMRKDYELYGDELWDRFNQKDSNKQGWYYRTLANILDDLKEYDAWQEYNNHVLELFGEG